MTWTAPLTKNLTQQYSFLLGTLNISYEIFFHTSPYFGDIGRERLKKIAKCLEYFSNDSNISQIKGRYLLLSADLNNDFPWFIISRSGVENETCFFKNVAFSSHMLHRRKSMQCLHVYDWGFWSYFRFEHPLSHRHTIRCP